MQSRRRNVRPDDLEASMLSINEALEVFGGKWKIPILLNLTCGRKRFSEIKDTIKGISSKILSNQLKQLEEHCLIKKEFCEEHSVFYYSLINSNCGPLEKIIDGLREWGDYHRTRIFQRTIHTRSIKQFVNYARKYAFKENVSSHN